MGVSRSLVENVEWGIKNDYVILVIVIAATNSRRPWYPLAVVPDWFYLEVWS